MSLLLATTLRSISSSTAIVVIYVCKLDIIFKSHMKSMLKRPRKPCNALYQNIRQLKRWHRWISSVLKALFHLLT